MCKFHNGRGVSLDIPVGTFEKIAPAEIVSIVRNIHVVFALFT